MFEFFKIAAIIVAAVAYTLSPIDLIPDPLLGPGQIDDIAVIVFAVQNVWKRIKAAKQAKAFPMPRTPQGDDGHWWRGAR